MTTRAIPSKPRKRVPAGAAVMRASKTRPALHIWQELDRRLAAERLAREELTVQLANALERIGVLELWAWGGGPRSGKAVFWGQVADLAKTGHMPLETANELLDSRPELTSGEAWSQYEQHANEAVRATSEALRRAEARADEVSAELDRGQPEIRISENSFAEPPIALGESEAPSLWEHLGNSRVVRAIAFVAVLAATCAAGVLLAWLGLRGLPHLLHH